MIGLGRMDIWAWGLGFELGVDGNGFEGVGGEEILGRLPPQSGQGILRFLRKHRRHATAIGGIDKSNTQCGFFFF